MKPAPVASAACGGNASTGPYFHHFLDRNSSANSSTNSLLYNPNANYGETSVSANTSGKRPRSSNNSNSSFLTPLGYPSPLFDADHPLPDFNTNWGFSSRNVMRSSSSTTSAPLSSSSALTIGYHSNSNVTSSSGLSGMGSGLSSPNSSSMFAGVDSFLPDYDSTLYSLWNTPSGGGVMGYDTENDAAQGQQQQDQPPLYMASEDELKMDYPQLTEFNQDLDSYLSETIESGGPSPTTPLGTSTSSGMAKMDHLVTTDRRTVSVGVGGGNLTGSREPRLLAPAATATAGADYLLKRGRNTTDMENASGRSMKRSRTAHDDAYAAAPVSSASIAASNSSGVVGSFRSVPKNKTIEPKRAAMPPLESYHNGPLLIPTSATTSQAVTTSSGSAAPTSIVTATATTPDAKASKRPRSRQCEFPGCQNRARSHQKCKKHGGAHRCVFEGCTKNSQSRGLCIAHGGGSRCKREGCVRAAQSKGLCKSHGGGEFCAVEGCHKKAHLKHLCRTHGGGVRCKFEKCTKWAQRKGWCMSHAKQFEAI
ncbi:unnamed protein product [Phytophthora lilii]|uniref:Unnamed protein product n=1 Tax=Phytophthora lilii TaxID=2077276 RepID=A0A9W6TQS6_9STRA|nr:unnamed protein product [Phytophthora lilii]